jgi:hypothetical protein
MQDVISYLPDVVWYLTSNGKDMWCRSPYGFFFTTQEAAAAFAKAQTALELVPIGIAAKELISDDGLRAMRGLAVTRVFLDPQIDPASGDVFGKILRIEATN